MGGIIPNKEDGITPGVLWAVTDPQNTSYNLGDSQSFGGLSERLGYRGQANITAELQDNVKHMTEWKTSSTNVFQGIGGGLPGMFITFFAQLLGIPPDTVTQIEGDLNGLLGLVEQVPILGQLIEALTGGNVAGSSGMAGLGAFFNFIPGSSNIISAIEGVVANIPIVGPVIDTFLTYLLGTPTTGGNTNDLASALPNLPLIGPLLELFTGSTTGAGGGMGGLTSVFSDFMSLLGLGSGSGLGTGSPTLGSDIPILGPIVSIFTGFLSGGSSSSSALGDLSPLLSNIPLIGPLLELFTGSATGAGGGIGGLTSVFSDFMSLLGLGSSSGLGTGSPTLGSEVPVLGPVISLFTSFLSGGTSSSSLLSDLDSLVNNIPLIGPLITSLTGGNVDPSAGIGGLASFFNFGPGTGNILDVLAQAGADFAQLVEAFIPGFSGGTQGDFNTIISNLLSMLGNPLGLKNSGGGFNPITAIQQFAQAVGIPAGLLSSSSWVPVHTLGGLNSGSGVQTNALADADPGFGDPTRFMGNTVFTLDGVLDHTHVAGSGSARYMADGTLARLVSVPVAVKANANITLGTYTHWAGLVTTSGNAIRLAINVYDVNDVLLTNQVVSAIASPPASSIGYSGTDTITPSNLLSADAAGWVYLSGSMLTPTNTAYVCLCVEVGAAATAGQVNFDDVAIYLPGLVDAGLLHNFDSMEQGTIPGVVMQGFQALPDIFGSFGHLFDGLGSAFSLSSQSGLSFSNLFGLAQNSSVDSQNALTQSIVNTNVLNFRQNQPSAAGANMTTEAMLPLPHFGTGGAVTTTTVPAGTAILQKFNPGAVAQKGFVDFMASLPAGTSGGVFLNILKWTGSAWSSVWSSADLTSLIPTAINDMVRALIPGSSQPTMNAGEQYMIGLANNTGAVLTVAAKDTGVPNNSHEAIPNMGATRTLATSGGATPSSLANSALSYSGKVPYFGVGILNVPASYVPPTTDSFDTPGAGTWTIPSFARVAGAIVDVVALGPGGGGQANYGTLTWWTGGNAGGWAVQRLVCGVDYPVGATSMSYVVGTKGSAAGAYWTNGHKGNDTTITWNDGTTNHTIAGAAGDGGGNGSTSGSNGKSPGNQIFHNQLYPGGGEVGGNANGSPSGGGGGGAGPYQTGGDGADGRVWFKAAQAA